MEVRPPVQSGAQPPEPATAGVEGSDPPPLALRGTCERCRQSKVSVVNHRAFRPYDVDATMTILGGGFHLRRDQHGDCITT